MLLIYFSSILDQVEIQYIVLKHQYYFSISSFNGKTLESDSKLLFRILKINSILK